MRNTGPHSKLPYWWLGESKRPLFYLQNRIVMLAPKQESVFYFVILSSLQTCWLPKLFFKESKFETRPNVESIKCFSALWIPPLFEDLFTTNSITQNCFHLPNILGSLGRQYCLAVKRISFTDSAISKLNCKLYFLEMFDVFPRRGKYNFWL